MRALFGICRAIDRLSAAAALVAAALTLILVVCTLYEVVMRYFFGAPTIWAFDVAYMLNGALFMLAVAGALRVGAHVRIDFLAVRLPARFASLVDGLFFLIPASIVVGALVDAAVSRTARAIATGETEAVSPWAPLMWPFYTALTIGLGLLLLQCVAQGVRSTAAAFGATDPHAPEGAATPGGAGDGARND